MIIGHAGLSVAVREMRCAMYRLSRKKRWLCMTDNGIRSRQNVSFVSPFTAMTSDTCIQRQLRTPPSFFGSYFIQHSTSFDFCICQTLFCMYMLLFLSFSLWEDGRWENKTQKKVRVWSGSTTEIKKVKKNAITVQSLSLIRQLPSEIRHQSHTEWSCSPK